MLHMKTRLLFVLGIGATIVAYQQLSDSHKRFLKELLRQVPFLVPRYFV